MRRSPHFGTLLLCVEFALTTSCAHSGSPSSTSHSDANETAGKEDIEDKAAPAGKLEPSAVQDTIGQHSESILGCYESRLVSRPELAGKIVVEFTIESDGKVTSVEAVENRMGDAVVERCLLDEISTWVFPRPEGGIVEVTYPFMFRTP